MTWRNEQSCPLLAAERASHARPVSRSSSRREKHKAAGPNVGRRSTGTTASPKVGRLSTDRPKFSTARPRRGRDAEVGRRIADLTASRRRDRSLRTRRRTDASVALSTMPLQPMQPADWPSPRNCCWPPPRFFCSAPSTTMPATLASTLSNHFTSKASPRGVQERCIKLTISSLVRSA